MLARREKESEREGETKSIVKGIQKAKIFPLVGNTEQHLEMDSPVRSGCIVQGCLNNEFFLFDHPVLDRNNFLFCWVHVTAVI